jgi:hypothetical protein
MMGEPVNNINTAVLAPSNRFRVHPFIAMPHHEMQLASGIKECRCFGQVTSRRSRWESGRVTTGGTEPERNSEIDPFRVEFTQNPYREGRQTSTVQRQTPRRDAGATSGSHCRAKRRA